VFSPSAPSHRTTQDGCLGIIVIMQFSGVGLMVYLLLFVAVTLYWPQFVCPLVRHMPNTSHHTPAAAVGEGSCSNAGAADSARCLHAQTSVRLQLPSRSVGRRQQISGSTSREATACMPTAMPCNESRCAGSVPFQSLCQQASCCCADRYIDARR
jgi:hypothetical protein